MAVKGKVPHNPLLQKSIFQMDRRWVTWLCFILFGLVLLGLFLDFCFFGFFYGAGNIKREVISRLEILLQY